MIWPHHPFNSLAKGRLLSTPKRVAMRSHPPECTCSTYTTRPSTPFIYSFFFLLCVFTPQNTVCMWKSEKSLWESVPSFQHAGSWDQTRAARLGSECLYLLSHCAGPLLCFYLCNQSLDILSALLSDSSVYAYIVYCNVRSRETGVFFLSFFVCFILCSVFNI